MRHIIERETGHWGRGRRRAAVLAIAIPLALSTLCTGCLHLYENLYAAGNAFVPALASASTEGTDQDGTGQYGTEQGSSGQEDPRRETPADASPASGPIEADVAYASEIVEANDPDNPTGTVSTALSFDDAWFSQDSSAYNHDLARACAVLCAVCNAESKYYTGEAETDYLGAALAALGFQDVESGSYEQRSGLFNEIRNAFSGDTDVAAFAFARKALADGRTLVFVGVRGTYGTEWLSNFNFLGSSYYAQGADHAGFKLAEREIVSQLSAYCDDRGIEPRDAVFLVTGHSRGGAIANLLAAELDNAWARSAGPECKGDAARNVYAYTFAAPNVTLKQGCGDARFGNIFNVENPADFVCRLPLSSWGYQRYGTTVEIPSSRSADFAAQHARMQERRTENTGYASSAADDGSGQDAELEEAERRIGQSAPEAEQLLSVEGLAGLVQALGKLNLGALVAAHYPDTYIAWMQALEADELAFE